jgi:transposase-like protein
MENQGYKECPICKSVRIKVDRYYMRKCLNCQAEWTIQTASSKFEIIYNPKKEVLI